MRVDFAIDHEAEKKDLEKYANLTFLLDIWLSAIEQNKVVTEYFIKNSYKNVCIYGMGLLGKHLRNQLKESDIDVPFTIERDVVSYSNANSVDINMIKDKISVPDVIVVTPIMEFRYIKAHLEQYFDTDIVSIEEVIMSL